MSTTLWALIENSYNKYVNKTNQILVTVIELYYDFLQAVDSTSHIQNDCEILSVRFCRHPVKEIWMTNKDFNMIVFV